MTERARWAVEGRDWPNRDHSQFITSGSLRWHVQQWAGPSAGAPRLLLLHGTGSATHSWRTLAPLLARDHAVLAVDLPGHGFTEGRPRGGLAMGAMARAVADLVTRLDYRPDIVIGHSAGAAIAIRMALDAKPGDAARPRGIIGLNPALLPFPGLAARIFPTLARLLFVNPFAPMIFSRMARSPGEVARFLGKSTGSRIDADGARFYGRLFATPAQCAGAITMMADWDLDSLSADLGRVPVPVLLVAGERDAAIPADNAVRAAEMIPDADAIILPRLGHLAHEEDPAAVAAEIVAYIAQVMAPA